MSITLTQSKKEESKIEYGRDMEKTVASKGFKVYTDYISNLRSEALYHVMAVDVESVRWRERLRTLDEVLGVPDVILRKAKITQMSEEQNG